MTQKKINIHNKDVVLEAILKSANSAEAPAVLILHPHPLHGGTMNNRVVFHIAKIFNSLGFTTLRVNFRGVEGSTGTYNDGNGELSDAISAMRWLQDNYSHAKEYWIAGFSFGSWIASKLLLMQQKGDFDNLHKISHALIVGAPMKMFDFGKLNEVNIPMFFVHGEQDDIAPIEHVVDFIKTSDEKSKLKIINNADHFFVKHLNEFDEIISDYIDENY